MAVYSYRGSYKDIINKVRETDLKSISGPRIREMVKMFDRIYSLHDGQLIGSEYMSVLDAGLKKYYDIQNNFYTLKEPVIKPKMDDLVIDIAQQNMDMLDQSNHDIQQNLLAAEKLL